MGRPAERNGEKVGGLSVLPFFDHTPVCGSKDSIENLMGQVDRFIDGMASRNDPDINLLLSRKPQARNDARPEVN